VGAGRHKHHVRPDYQTPASSNFLSEETSHQQLASSSFSLRTNQHQPSATSQANKLKEVVRLISAWLISAYPDLSPLT
jgi:hypothetical protein